ncbi:MAG TPA: hypothetical protein ENK24_04630, partial [Anaerolineae bacterium]|nr:hypothetical protein [Anaerolineae bacterium]
SSLRYALSNLRRVIGDRVAEPPFLRITRHALQFNSTGNVWLDVADFAQTLNDFSNFEEAALLDVESAAQLERAATLYRGDFLAGFSLKDSSPFEEWVLFTRERLARQAAGALRQLLRIYRQEGQIEPAQRCAQRLLQLEPWQEETHQALMRLLALKGRRAEALAQYQTCRQILADEFGVEPLPETTALYHHIRAGDLGELDELDEKTGRLEGKTGDFPAVLSSGGDETALPDSRLAQHFEAAGLVDKAVTYLWQSGRRAVRMSAYVEAVALFTHALALLDTLPESPARAQQELRLSLALDAPLLAIRGWGAAERARAGSRVIELCRRNGNTGQLLQTLFLQADLHRAKGEHQKSLAIAEQYLDLAQLAQEPLQIALAYWTLGATQFFLGALPASKKHLEKAIALRKAHRDRALLALTGPDPAVACLSWLSWVLWGLGYPDQALARSREALALAEELKHAFSMGFALAFAGCGLSQMRREAQAAQKFAEAMAQIVDQELAAMQAWATVFQGWRYVTRGQITTGITLLRDGITSWQEMGAVSGLSFQSLLLIEAYSRSGQIEAGLKLTAETLAGIDRSNERFFEAELHRLKGELLLKAEESGLVQNKAEDRQAAAEACFLYALKVARRQQAKSWELRAAMSLARLWQETGRGAEARQKLAEIYGQFNEGFDTPDLQAARDLLAEP